MTDESDRVMTAVSIALGVVIILGIGALVFAAMNAPSDGTEQPPEVTWDIDRVNDTYVRIVHTGGEPVSTTNLSVTVNGASRSVTWSGTVTEGDTGIVFARPTADMQLYWMGGRGDRVLMESWELGDRETTTSYPHTGFIL